MALAPDLRRARAAARRAENAQTARDIAIRDAARVHSYQQIATATGLSKSRVQQIVK